MRISGMKYLVIGLFLMPAGCANIKLVSSDRNQHKFCTNAGNKIAKDSDFDDAASKKCGGSYRVVSSGLEFFTDPKADKIGGILEVQKERRMCRVYECEK